MSTQVAGGISPVQFVAKWERVQLAERAASQEHFLDLCRMLGQPTPAEHDATGSEYAFEKGVAVSSGASKGSKGDRGFADVWWRGKFGWEYKTQGKYKTLDDAYRQLCQYREALESPPLLIVSDIARIEIHTNFTGTVKKVHAIALADIASPASIDLLRRVFTDPQSFKPTITPAKVTEEIATQFGTLAASLHKRGHDPHDAAHFLMKCMFCLFAEDVDLLPKELFKRMLLQWHRQPAQLVKVMAALFEAMRAGGAFGSDPIAWFNGGLFEEPPGKPQALELTESEIGVLIIAAKQDWSSVEPAIFGTLFERSLDPTKRAQIGAHYTSREDILLVVEPVILAPLRREWEEVKAKIETQLAKRRAFDADKTITKKKAQDGIRNANNAISKLLTEFDGRLSAQRILDPACGSGNFLYVAIQQLLNLEKELITVAARPEIGKGLLPRVRPTQLHGIEINPYAAELAQVVIWIGYLQWMRDNGFNAPRDPILESIKSIENRDAILDLSDPAHPAPAKWPQADFIIGNPPFLGSKVFRQNGLTDDYVSAMYAAFDLPKTSDLCCYWFELARRSIETSIKYGGKGIGDGAFAGAPADVRVGLLATQGIRGGDNRTVLKRIKETGDIFLAWSDLNWILDGAMVHVSIVGFDCGDEQSSVLDGQTVSRINADLTSDTDTTQAVALDQNANIVFMGDTKGGAFDIEWSKAREILTFPNPNSRSNIEVIRPWVNGGDITKRRRAMWIIDFGCDMPENQASGFEAPFRLVEQLVKPLRLTNRRAVYAEKWWIHVEPRPALRAATEHLTRTLFTTNVSKHRLFAWITHPTLPDHAGFVFARCDDYFFGIVHSALHEQWARGTGTQLREAESGFRYTPTTCFETFPLPWPPGKEPVDHPAYQRISEAARELNEQRERWLNPPEWIDPIARQVDAEDTFEDVPEAARPLIRQSAIMARAAKDARLKKRTLTNLYNERPTWLKLAHEKLDRAVLAAYAAVDSAGGWDEEWATVWKENGAGQPLPATDPLATKRAEVDQLVLANLLRMNHERAGK